MVYKIDPINDWSYVDEFRRSPIGHHSPNLQRILNIMRFDCSGFQTILIVRVPLQEWVLGVLPPDRAAPVITDHNAEVFYTREDAEWAVFCARWERHTGEKIHTSRTEPLQGKTSC